LMRAEANLLQIADPGQATPGKSAYVQQVSFSLRFAAQHEATRRTSRNPNFPRCGKSEEKRSARPRTASREASTAGDSADASQSLPPKRAKYRCAFPRR